jgi:hypothetical protein
MKKWWWWRAGQSLRIGTAFGIFRNAHGGASPPTPAQSARQRQSPVLPLPGTCGGRRGRPTKARPSPLTLDGATLKRGGLRAHGERKLFFLSRPHQAAAHPLHMRTPLAFKSPACAAQPASAHWVATPSHAPGAEPNAHAPVAAPHPAARFATGAAAAAAGSGAQATRASAARAVAARKVRRMAVLCLRETGRRPRNAAVAGSRDGLAHSLAFFFFFSPGMLACRPTTRSGDASLALPAHIYTMQSLHARRADERPSTHPGESTRLLLAERRPCRHRPGRLARRAAAGGDGGGAAPPAAPPTVILYTKAGCSLCEGLEVCVCVLKRRMAPNTCAPAFASLDPTPPHTRLARSPWADGTYSPAPVHWHPAPQQKVRAALDRAAFLPSPLTGAGLEVRDIEERKEWVAAFNTTVPVLKVILGGTRKSTDASEYPVARPAPRAPAERVGAALEAALLAAACV